MFRFEMQEVDGDKTPVIFYKVDCLRLLWQGLGDNMGFIHMNGYPEGYPVCILPVAIPEDQMLRINKWTNYLDEFDIQWWKKFEEDQFFDSYFPGMDFNSWEDDVVEEIIEEIVDEVNLGDEILGLVPDRCMEWRGQPALTDWRKVKKGRWLACYCPVAPDQLSFRIVEGREDNEIIYISHKLLDNNRFEDEGVR